MQNEESGKLHCAIKNERVEWYSTQKGFAFFFGVRDRQAEVITRKRKGRRKRRMKERLGNVIGGERSGALVPCPLSCPTSTEYIHDY